MDRYFVTNGLMRPRRIDADGTWTICGVDRAPQPTGVVEVVDPASQLQATRFYAYVAAYASSIYTRPVATADGSSNYTRGNPGDPFTSGAISGAGIALDVTVPTTDQAGMTHVLLYRSLGAGNAEEAAIGPFYYAGQALMVGAQVVIRDGLNDAQLGLAVEVDNYPPPTYRYAILANGFVFVMGNIVLGAGYTVTVTAGSSVVTADSGEPFYDGIRGWFFKVDGDQTGGANEGGLYFANFVSPTELQLIGADNNPLVYNSTNAGTGRTFTLYTAGNVLRWCKYEEPEAWPLSNLINYEGDSNGIAQIPGQPLVLVCTDTPVMVVHDLNLIGTATFLRKHVISREYTVSSHYSLHPAEGRMRGICMQKKCLIETDGTSVRDISSGRIPRIFDHLSQDRNDQVNWHCAYDQAQKLFGAFVTYLGALRTVDFAICQHLVTGEWFFQWEKDLLSTGDFIDPITGRQMVLGGTEGIDGVVGGVWGRIWAPDVWDDWIPSDTLLYGTITNVADSTTFDVDTSSDTLFASGNSLAGRWVMVCNADGEYAQVGFILSNTSSRIQIQGVLGGLSQTEFNPVPAVGWRFYLGLIEMRWGPRRWEFEDPDEEKKVDEVWTSMENIDPASMPFARLYRGYEPGYDKQMAMQERRFMDNTGNQSLLLHKYDSKLEPTARWGTAVYDRSYDEVKFHSLTIVFRRLK